MSEKILRERKLEEAREEAEKEALARAEAQAWRDEEARTAEERLGKIEVLEEKAASEPNNWMSHLALAELLDKCWSRYADHLRKLEVIRPWDFEARKRLKADYPEDSFTERYEGYRRKACECYFKAVVLGIEHPLYSGTAKLRYAILLGRSGHPYWDPPLDKFKHIGPVLLLYGSVDETWGEPGITERIRHYAREAEKDLRKRLQKYPDDIPALRKLGQAVALHQESDRVRSERLAAIDARIAEAEMRRQMSVAPSSHLASPGAPESPYPDNWKQLSEAAKHRDGHKCTDCGASGVELHVHHIVPLSKGGTNDLDNLTTLCSMCHSMIHPRMGDAP